MDEHYLYTQQLGVHPKTREREIEEVLTFYRDHAPPRLVKYPKDKDKDWIQRALETSFWFIGTRYRGKLVGVTWMALRRHRPYFLLQDDHLVLCDGGDSLEVGGTYVIEEYRRKWVNDMLCGRAQADWLAWPKEPHQPHEHKLWARVTGVQSEDGQPLFWALVGEKYTGVSYDELLSQPFASQEDIILAHWPAEPMPLKELPPVIAQEVLGRPASTHVGYQSLFNSWGFCVTAPPQYAANSLNQWRCCTPASVHVPSHFARRVALAFPLREDSRRGKD